jgi:hypothetical protein
MHVVAFDSSRASAYLDRTPAVVRYRLRRHPRRTRRPRHLPKSCDGQGVEDRGGDAGLSRRRQNGWSLNFVREGVLTPHQAQLAQRVPVAHEITAEADSGGHTDNRPAITLIPTSMALRDRMQERYAMPLRVGGGGGIAHARSRGGVVRHGGGLRRSPGQSIRSVSRIG